MKVDWQFLALSMCAVFGWTISDVFHLTWPQFMYIGTEIERIEFMRARNEMYFPVCAALGDEKTQTEFLESAGKFVLPDEDPVNLSYTKEDLKRAQARMDAHVRMDPNINTEEKHHGV